jgi:hypothetical protein
MRVAVLFTTYSWDKFVERQYQRVLATAHGADVFVMVDETRKRLPTSAERVIRTSQKDLEVTLGLPLRFEPGLGKDEPLWWNLDYLTYRFFIENPDYDYCITLDYDACINIDLAHIVSEMKRHQIDLVAEPPYINKEGWYWEKLHLDTYSSDEIEGRLLCIMIMSHHAAEILFSRRRAMADVATKFWPFCEVFVPVEMKRAGLKMEKLSMFGSVDRFGFRPPYWEGNYGELRNYSFVHPVLDSERFLNVVIPEHLRLSDIVRPRSEFGRQIRQLKMRDVAPIFARELRSRLPRRFGF